jgi:hypothetical protein
MVALAGLFVAGLVGVVAPIARHLYIVYAIGRISGAVYSACIWRRDEMVPRSAAYASARSQDLTIGTALTIRPVAYLIEHNGYRTAFVVSGSYEVFVLLSTVPNAAAGLGTRRDNQGTTKKCNVDARPRRPKCCAADHSICFT